VQIQEGTVALWMLDFARSTLTPFPTGSGSSQAPVWTPDGSHVIYRGTRGGTRNLYSKAADGTGREERLTTKTGVNQTPTSVSPDGRWLVYEEQGGGGPESRIWLLPLTGNRVPQPLDEAASVEKDGQVSPDGRWLAYESSESGRTEIYVQPFLRSGPRLQVSTEGGTESRWSRDGHELFFREGDRKMAIAVSESGAGLVVGPPRPIYQGHYLPANNWNTPYDLGGDGRFLDVQVTHPGRPLDDIDVVLDWTAKLDELQGSKSP